MSGQQVVASERADFPPSWATKHCADCGEMFLPGHGGVWHGKRPDVHTHGGLRYCEAQREWVEQSPDTLAILLCVQEQALVEIAQSLGRFICEADDENWNDEVASVVFAAQHAAEEGYKAWKLDFAEGVSRLEGSNG